MLSIVFRSSCLGSWRSAEAVATPRGADLGLQNLNFQLDATKPKGLLGLSCLSSHSGTMDLNQQFDNQHFPNGYELVDGVAMHSENPENFHIPPAVIKRHIGPGQFVEVRIDSPRFSVHQDAPQKCTCPSCNGELTKPILRHGHPASLVPLPKQKIPSRGWGEDFWVRVTERSGDFLRGAVDNPLVEAARKYDRVVQVGTQRRSDPH